MRIRKIYIKKSYIGQFKGGVFGTLIHARDVQSQDLVLISFFISNSESALNFISNKIGLWINLIII